MEEFRTRTEVEVAATDSVWRNRDFIWLIGGQTVSEFGSAVSAFAIPWLLLQMTGSALQMGLAFAIGFVPYLLLSLPAGVWADRHNRKRLMMAADTLRMLLVLSIPVAHAFGALVPAHLYLVMALMSACNAVFDASYTSCLPNVVGKDQLQVANSALQAGMSTSQILGPALAGTAVGFIGAANTLVVDALSYAISAASLLAIRRPFSTHGLVTTEGGMLQQIAEGLRYVWSHRLIRTISLFTLVGNLGGSAASALVLYRLTHDLHASASWSGLVMTGVSVGAIIGSVLSGIVARRFSMGAIMMVSLFLFAIPDFVTAWARQPFVIGCANVLLGVSMVLWNVQSMSLRQSVIPDHLRGRANSSIRMIVWASIPLGNAAGGAFGQWFGAPTVFITTGLMHTLVWALGWWTPLYASERLRDARSSVPGDDSKTPALAGDNPDASV
jgi:MFS family permease